MTTHERMPNVCREGGAWRICTKPSVTKSTVWTRERPRTSDARHALEVARVVWSERDEDTPRGWYIVWPAAGRAPLRVVGPLGPEPRQIMDELWAYHADGAKDEDELRELLEGAVRDGIEQRVLTAAERLSRQAAVKRHDCRERRELVNDLERAVEALQEWRSATR